MDLPLCCWWLIWPIQNDAKKTENVWNPGKWVLIWEYSARSILWIATWQGLDGFQKSLHLCALDESFLSIEKVDYLEAVVEMASTASMILWRAESVPMVMSVPQKSLSMDPTMPTTFRWPHFSFSSSVMEAENNKQTNKHI